MSNDDVNDAAWILTHAVMDVAPNGRPLCFTPAERARLHDAADLFCKVYSRYGGGDD